MKNNIKIISVLVLVLALGFTGGWIGKSQVDHTDVFNTKSNNINQVESLQEVGLYDDIEILIKALQERHLYKINPKEMRIQVLKAMVNSMGDKYSSYMDKDEYENFIANVTGDFEGIGITFVDLNGKYIIYAVVEDSPADKSGLSAGDEILEVDGKHFKDVDKMGSSIRGKAGTVVKLKIKGTKGKIKNLSITRDKIKTRTVEYKDINSKTFYVGISSFEKNTAKDYKKAVKKGMDKGKRNMILDLRNNGGGMVISCLEIADTLLGKGRIVSIKKKTGKSESFFSDKNKLPLKYVVLANEYSASASEIILAAIKDHEAGSIVGKTTYGKGIIQDLIILDNGDALKYTSSEYISPKGKKIHKKGITPDFKISGDKAQLNKAIELLK